MLDDDESTLFLGIGSIIQHGYDPKARKVVVGSGYGGYTKKPDVHDGTWDFRFVRGPQTAEDMGLSPDLAIVDAAVLLRSTPLPAPAEGIDVAFMPHYESLERGNWKRVCEIAGVHFLDPSAPHEQTIAEIRGANLVITEAMHGAIVSDAMRTPWIGVRTMHHVHRYKWNDWARSLDIDYQPVTLWPSNGREAWAFTTGRWGSGPKARMLLEGPIAAPANFGLLHSSARSMKRIARGRPSLSSDAAIERATERALAAVNRFVRDYADQSVPA
nr:polysaccharide pyruvyl transferase family protein [Pseudoruegeria sp. HB172150]